MRLVVAVALGLLVVGGCTGKKEKSAKDRAEFHYKLANNAFYEKSPIEAIQELSAALQLDPTHKESHHLLGFIYFGRKQYDEAETHFVRAVELDPKFFEARTNLGALYLAQERWGAAVSTLTPLLEERLYPTPHLLQNNLGWAKYHLGKFEEAQAHYETALFLKPRMCLAHNNLGLVYLATDRYDLAVRSFDRAISRCGDYQEPYANLGDLYLETGQLDLARQSYQKCYEEGPESPLGTRCRSALDGRVQ